MANPKFDLWLTDKEDTKSRTKIGVAFENEWGGLSVRLGPGVLIDARVRERCYFVLNPWKGKPGADSVSDKKVAGSTPTTDDDPF